MTGTATDRAPDRTGGGGEAGPRPPARRAVPVSVLAACALVLLQGLLWAWLNPALRAPDETQHVNSVLRLAEGGGWPPAGDALTSQALFGAMDQAGVLEGGRTVLPRGPERFDPRTNPAAPIFSLVEPTPEDERDSLEELEDTNSPYRSIDQMTQHPPGYYALAAGVFDLASLEDWRYDRAVFALRALTAVMLSVVPLCAYLTARRLRLPERTARLSAFVPAAIPQVGFLGGSVTNDGLTVLLVSIGIVLLTAIAVDGPTARRSLALGVVCGLACLVKATALPLIPLIPVAVLLGLRRRGERGTALVGRALVPSLVTLAVAFVVGGWWWGLNLLRYGTVQPPAYELAPAPLPEKTKLEFAGAFVTRVGNSFFGNFGQLELPLSYTLTRVLTVVLVLLVVVAFVRRGSRGTLLLLFVLPAVSLVLLFQTTYAAHVETHLLPGLQGRYLFIALVPISVAVALGLDVLGTALRAPRTVAVLAVLAGLGLAVFGAWHAFRGYYWEPGQPLEAAVSRWIHWAPYDWRWFAVLLVPAGVAALLVLAGQLARERAARDRPGTAGPAGHRPVRA
jgi:4-amino-4-deoxy-L-arabinose transferase-like glycosyltransferase